MKDQYFGDENDYRKYGLLRVLAESTGLRIGVCWMRTPDDGRSDGRFTAYLERPAAWRAHDPALFDALRDRLHAVPARRALACAREDALVPRARWYEPGVPEAASERAAWFAAALAALADCPLVFCDPDNGFEVASASARTAPKYLRWAEAGEAWRAGHSLLVYQHWPRVEREAYTRRRGAELRAHLAGADVRAFRTARVLFLLALQPAHVPLAAGVDAALRERWAGQITPGRA